MVCALRTRFQAAGECGGVCHDLGVAGQWVAVVFLLAVRVAMAFFSLTALLVGRGWLAGV